MKQNLITKIKVYLRNAYAFQVNANSSVSTEEYFTLMQQALHQFAQLGWNAQLEALQDKICRACVAAWVVHTQPASAYADAAYGWQSPEAIEAANLDNEVKWSLKEHFTAENVRRIFNGAWQYVDWEDESVTQTPGQRQIDWFLGKPCGTRRSTPPTGARRIRGAH